MRYAIFGDIHGNLEALNAVLDNIPCQGGVDEFFCLGDIVGYGANPEECVKLIRELGSVCIAGNHDHAVIGCLDPSYFNEYARRAAVWTRDQLSPSSIEYLRSLSLILHAPSFSLVHGSLHSPELFNYVQTMKDAERNFLRMENPLLFIGHSHQPVAFIRGKPHRYSHKLVTPIDASTNTIVNIGSVGQPRDEDPRASYAIYDEELAQVTVYRIPYNIQVAADKILAAGLPDTLALRLNVGK